MATNATGGGFLDLLRDGLDTWGDVKKTQATTKAEIYSRSALHGSELYPAGYPATMQGPAAFNASSLVVVGGLVLLAAVALYALRR